MGMVQLLDQIAGTVAAPTDAADGVAIWSSGTKRGGLRRGQEDGVVVIRSVAGSGVMTITARLWLQFPVKSRARGLLTALAAASLLDAETFTLNDGINAAKVFEFDKAGDGVTAGRVAVDITGNPNLATVGARIAVAINSQPQASFQIRAVDNGDGTVTLINQVPGTQGNQSSSETVANAGFVLTAMAGAVDFVWAPAGTNATPASKGLLNEGNAIGETGTDAVAHAEVVFNLEHATRAAIECSSVTGTFSAWLLSGELGGSE